MNIKYMTRPLGYRQGTREGELVGDKEEMIKSYELAKSLNPDGRISDKDFNFAEKMLGGNITEKEKIALAYKLAQAQNPDGRFSEKDFQYALKEVNASSADPSSMKSLADIITGSVRDISGRITDTDRAFAAKPLNGFEDRMSMLRKAMTDTEATRRADMATGDPEKERTSTFGTVTEDNVRDVALKIARQQGDTSEENINLIIRQLMALTPSLEQTVGEETGWEVPKGLDALKDKARIMMGLKSDPMLRRDVGFERVR